MNIPRARFEHGIENISFRVKNSRRFGSNGVERDCSRFWGKVWRSLYILVYNKKREEASRVGGKVAYLIVRRKVHPDTKSTMKACYHLVEYPLNFKNLSRETEGDAFNFILFYSFITGLK